MIGSGAGLPSSVVTRLIASFMIVNLLTGSISSISISSWRRGHHNNSCWLIPSPFGLKTNYQWINDHIRPMNQDQPPYCQVGGQVQNYTINYKSEIPISFYDLISVFMQVNKYGLGVNLHIFWYWPQFESHSSRSINRDDEFSLKKLLESEY